MVGTPAIGALRTLPAAPVDQAVGYALGLISGWEKKNREPFKKALEELREAAAHNEKIHEQAAAALGELSVKDKEVRELVQRAQTTTAEAVALRRGIENEVAGKLSALEAAQLAHAGQVKDFDLSSLAREENLTAREAKVVERTRLTAVASGVVSRREREVEALGKEATAVRDRYESSIAGIEAIIKRTAS